MKTEKFTELTITDEQKKAWEQKHGVGSIRIATLLSETEEPIAEIAICVPNRKILGLWEKHANSDPDKARDILVTNCVLGEAERDHIKADTELFMSASSAIMELLPFRKALVRSL